MNPQKMERDYESFGDKSDKIVEDNINISDCDCEIMEDFIGEIEDDGMDIDINNSDDDRYSVK